MIAAGYSRSLIVTIEQIYDRASTTPGTFRDRVKIKRGVL